METLDRKVASSNLAKSNLIKFSQVLHMAISQIELCENIVALLEEFGYKTMNMRQMNAVIQASTIIIAELSNPTSEAKPGMGFIAW